MPGSEIEKDARQRATQCSVGKDGEVYCRSVDFANISRKRDLESILETVNEVHSDMEPPEAPEQESTQGGITLI